MVQMTSKMQKLTRKNHENWTTTQAEASRRVNTRRLSIFKLRPKNIALLEFLQAILRHSISK